MMSQSAGTVPRSTAWTFNRSRACNPTDLSKDEQSSLASDETLPLFSFVSRISHYLNHFARRQPRSLDELVVDGKLLQACFNPFHQLRRPILSEEPLHFRSP